MPKLPAVTDQTYDKEVLQAPSVLVYCWAEWWGGCHAMAPVMEQLAKDYAGKVKVVGMDVDSAPDAASSLGIMSIPALVFFKGGAEAGRMGPGPRQKVVDAIKSYLGA